MCDACAPITVDPDGIDQFSGADVEAIGEFASITLPGHAAGAGPVEVPDDASALDGDDPDAPGGE